MQAEERTRVVIHREWVLETPAHHTEVSKALMVASQKHDAESGRACDIVFSHGDGLIVIGYQVEGTPTGLRREAEERLRAERDEWRRKAEYFQATVSRVRQLAVAWSGEDDEFDQRIWHKAASALHETLDGPGGEGADR